jgi:poly(3-hydroxybutyrate) depolymerase
MTTLFRRAASIACISVSLCAATSAFAFKLIGWDWSHQANPIATQFVFCGKDAPAGAAQVIKNAAAKWNYSKFTFRFSADDCPSTRPDNYIEFSALDDPNKTAENSHPNEGTSTRTKKCALRFNTAKKWNASNGMPSSTQTDLMSTALHEFGHCVGLDDVNMSGVVMSGVLQPGEIMRELTADDLAGRDKIYGAP